MNPIVFLLGAGSSVPAEMPRTADITKRVLSGRGVYYHTDDTFHIDESQIERPVWDDRTDQVVKFISGYVQPLISKCVPGMAGDEINYETLYYVVKQVRNHLNLSVSNPAVQPFAKRLKKQVEGSGLLAPSLGGGDDRCLEDLCNLTLDYISDIVWRMLSGSADSLDYLRSIVDATLDTDYASVHLFTLNHDLILEQYLKRRNLTYVDGLAHGDNFDRWDSGVFDEQSNIYLYKLHGSVDCYQMNLCSGDQRERVLGRPKFPGQHHSISNQTCIDLASGRPELLIGTEDKVHGYLGGHFFELHSRFYQMLKQTNRLIVCGYSFRDTGINIRIYDWLWRRPERKLCIIHPVPQQLAENATAILPSSLNQGQKLEQVIFISKSIEFTSWAEIREALS